MVEPRVVYACNHYIVESFDENVELFMCGDERRDLPSESDTEYSRMDAVLPNNNLPKDGIITIGNINCYSISEYITEDNEKLPLISGDCDVFSPGEHFDVVQATEMTDVGFIQTAYIKWYPEITPPEMYMLNMSYYRTVNKLYEENECPRCGGEGWYVGVFEDGNINPSSVDGGNKLIQSFLKYIYTRKLDSGYGSRMTSIPGKYNMSDSEIINMAIQTELMSFKDYYTDKISTAILNGQKVGDSERLVSQTVSNIEIDEQNRAIKVVVTFGTKDGTLSSVNLMVANL